MDWVTFQESFFFMFLTLVMSFIGGFLLGILLGYAWVKFTRSVTALTNRRNRASTTWNTSTFQDYQQGQRKYAHAIVLVISLVPLLMSFATTPALAKDLFTLATDTGYEYFIVDSEIVQPKISLTEVSPPMTLDLFRSSPNKTLTLRGTNILDMPITLDPGFRTSLTNRLITIAGRIDWSLTKPDIKERESTRDKQALTYFSIKEQPKRFLMAD